jgi:hypothetical protein
MGRWKRPYSYAETGSSLIAAKYVGPPSCWKITLARPSSCGKAQCSSMSNCTLLFSCSEWGYRLPQRFPSALQICIPQTWQFFKCIVPSPDIRIFSGGLACSTHLNCAHRQKVSIPQSKLCFLFLVAILKLNPCEFSPVYIKICCSVSATQERVAQLDKQTEGLSVSITIHLLHGRQHL